MKTYRILIPTLFYYPDYPSGSVRLAYDEAVFLAQRGHEVWIVTQDPDGIQPEYTQRDGLHVLHYPSPYMSTFNPRRANIHQQLTSDLLSRHLPTVDVVHGHAPLQYDGALLLYGNLPRRCYSVHSPVKLEMQASSRGESAIRKLYYTLNGQINHQVERRCLDSSQVITSDSAYTRKMLGQLHSPQIESRTKVVPGWVDMERFQIAPDRAALKQRFGWREDVPLLFTLRRLVPRNGIDRLIRALHQVKSSGRQFHMIIGGGGPLLDELKGLAQSLDLNDEVQFIGFVDDDALPLMYAACDVFILPSAELECFGLITLEAFAAGRPVLATPVGAIPEVINPIEPTWLARDTTPDAIANLIIAYLDGELPAHEPADLRTYVMNQYSRVGVLDHMAELILPTDSMNFEATL